MWLCDTQSYIALSFSGFQRTVPKYTPILEYFRDRFLGLSLQGSHPLLNSSHTNLYFSLLLLLLLLLLFHALFTVFYFFLHTTMMQMKCNEINYPHSQISQISNKISISSNIIKITIISKFHNFPTTPIIPIIKYNYFSTIKLLKTNQINFQ